MITKVWNTIKSCVTRIYHYKIQSLILIKQLELERAFTTLALGGK